MSWLLSFTALAATPAPPATLASPDNHLRVTFRLTAAGEPRYAIDLDGKTVLRESRLGVIRDDADFTRALQLASMTPAEVMHDEYELLTSKRRFNNYTASRRVFRLQSPQSQFMEITFQVSNDGVAFRYTFPGNGSQHALHRIRSEASSFNFPADARAWLQPIAVAKTGWSAVNPSYEELYEKDIPVGTPSPTGVGWVYPALFRSGDTWLLISETGLTRNYCGTRLLSRWRDSEYTVGFPDPLEHFQNGAVAPQSTLPWTTPWRIIAIGTLKTIVESTLGTDLAEKPAAAAAMPAGAPGKASWSWPLLGDDQTVYATQRHFVDYAAQMGWRYTLVDGLWDQQIGYDRLKDLVDYARSKSVRILSGTTPPATGTPRRRHLAT